MNNYINTFKVENISKGSLDSISSPSHSVKIQTMGGKVFLRSKGKTLLGIVNELLKTKSLLTSPSNVLPLHFKQTFPLIIWIFTEGEGDEIESRLPFKKISTLSTYANLNNSHTLGAHFCFVAQENPDVANFHYPLNKTAQTD